MAALHFVCAGQLPDARFVEVETPDGYSINAGEWRDRADGLTELVIQNVIVWRPISELPRDKTILVTVRRRVTDTVVGVFPAYVDDNRTLCNVETWAPNARDFDGPLFYASDWADLPEPAQALTKAQP